MKFGIQMSPVSESLSVDVYDVDASGCIQHTRGHLDCIDIVYITSLEIDVR